MVDGQCEAIEALYGTTIAGSLAPGTSHCAVPRGDGAEAGTRDGHGIILQAGLATSSRKAVTAYHHLFTPCPVLPKMAKGGSQLAQLKSTVKSSGINDRRQQSNSAKKRKRGQASNERDEAAARREALARISSDTKFNPFEERVTKVKHEVLGKKVKGAVGRPALAKQGGLAQRNAMLLPEYQNRNKTSTFIDRRFGETDSNLTPEERALERFTREKQRQAKGKKAALFNLNDDDAAGQEEELTHFGRSLSGMGNLPELSMMDRDGEYNFPRRSGRHFFGSLPGHL